MNLSDAHKSILCYAHTHKLTYMHTYRHKCIQIAFMYDHRFHFLCSKLLYLVSTNTNTHPYSNLHSYIH